MLEAFHHDRVSAYRDLAYELVQGVATLAVDPGHPANRAVVDLDRVPPEADGLVRFEADVRILRPTAGGNRRLLVVVPNRGLYGAVPFSLDTTALLGLADEPDPGDGFLLADGWTIAWCGWQWDVLDGIGLRAPVAAVGPGRLRVEFRPDADQPDHRLSDSGPLFRFADYPPAGTDQETATLSVRVAPMGEKKVLPRGVWRLTEDGRVELDGGFRAFHYYELVYQSSFAPVVGTGLLAFRDVSAWLRRGHDHAFAYGVSQSGRFLRHLLFEALNRDEDGGVVFDGVFTAIAGARRGEFNGRFGQPSLTDPITAAYGPPYDDRSLLENQRRVGGVPKVISVNSATEYWRGDAALVHQDPDTGADLPGDPDTRTYLIAGTDHLGPMGRKQLFPVANPTHRLDPGPVQRALFSALVEWASAGTPPPPSRVPRQADATAAERPAVIERFAAEVRPDPDHLPTNPRVDPDSTVIPVPLGPPTVSLVSAVDAGGNELAGVRLPAVAVPVSAYTGWNPRRPVPGLPTVLYGFVGSRLELAEPAVPRTRSSYAESAADVARQLVDDRLLLPADARRTVDEALALFDDRP